MVERNYANWIKQFDTPSREQKQLFLGEIKAKDFKPLISIVLVHRPYNSMGQLVRTLQSLRCQLYPNWECLVFIDEGADTPTFWPRLFLRALSIIDPRIIFSSTVRSIELSIPSVLNVGIELSQGQFLGFIQSGDALSQLSLSYSVRELKNTPSAQIIYGDEDYWDAHLRRSQPLFKSDWNPELFLTHFYLGSFLLLRKDRVQSASGFSEDFPRASVYDLVCRMIEGGLDNEIVHIPHILSHHHNPSQDDERHFLMATVCPLSAQIVISEHLVRLGQLAQVIQDPQSSKNRIRFALPSPLPLVSILIPIRDKVELLITCLESLWAKTTYPNFELIVIDNGSVEMATLDFLKKTTLKGVKVIRDDSDFNYSALNNRAARQAQGQYLCLLNNDIEILTPDWLEEMLSFASQPEVGCVGAKLWYPDERLQHGGVILGIGGVAGHAFKFSAKSDRGYADRLVCIQAIGAVTGACLVISKKKFEAVDGLDEKFAVAFNDVDFCLRIRSLGLRNVLTPYAQMIHHESVSRGHEDNPQKLARSHSEITLMKDRWGDQLLLDPNYNPNLTLLAEDFSLSWPPRV